MSVKWLKVAQTVSGRNQGLNPDLTNPKAWFLSVPLCLEAKGGVGEREDSKALLRPWRGEQARGFGQCMLDRAGGHLCPFTGRAWDSKFTTLSL